MTKKDSTMSAANWFSIYLKPRILLIVILGFASGLPRALSASTLGFWLTEAGISKTSIGLFSVIAIPYTLKFLWSPLVDGGRIPLLSRLLGQRRAWMLLTQTALIFSILALSMADPAIDAWRTAFFALLVAISSATQDIVIDAYRVEILRDEEQGPGAGSVVMGYRFGMLASGAGALSLAQHYSWQTSYEVMALLIGVCIMVVLLFAREPQKTEENIIPKSAGQWMEEYILHPFKDFMQRSHWVALLLFIVFYKFSDAFIGMMTPSFLSETGFTKDQVAAVAKLFGFVAAIVGSLAGGAMVVRLGLLRTLWAWARQLLSCLSAACAAANSPPRNMRCSVRLRRLAARGSLRPQAGLPRRSAGLHFLWSLLHLLSPAFFCCAGCRRGTLSLPKVRIRRLKYPRRRAKVRDAGDRHLIF
ncbi:MAG: MFS transporter [Alphaproteobacteria bacterium]|nr:MFS transporter [Alphaproteobacteria bacterium]